MVICVLFSWKLRRVKSDAVESIRRLMTSKVIGIRTRIRHAFFNCLMGRTRSFFLQDEGDKTKSNVETKLEESEVFINKIFILI